MEVGWEVLVVVEAPEVEVQRSPAVYVVKFVAFPRPLRAATISLHHAQFQQSFFFYSDLPFSCRYWSFQPFYNNAH